LDSRVRREQFDDILGRYISVEVKKARVPKPAAYLLLIDTSEKEKEDSDTDTGKSSLRRRIYESSSDSKTKSRSAGKGSKDKKDFIKKITESLEKFTLVQL
jgi:hypothetical protein